MYEVSVAGILNGRFSSFWDYALHYSTNILLFYVHATGILPMGLRRAQYRYWLLPLLLCAELIGYTFFTYALELLAVRFFDIQMTRSLDFDYTYAVRSVWRAIYFMGFATAYYFLRKYLKERMWSAHVEKQRLLDIIEKQHLQTELVRSQNAFLKAQINPHFLFNTLNFVYNSVRKTSVQAAETILSLSEMMRYALQTEDDQQTNLQEEIEQVEHLIQIHQIRHKHQLQLEFTYGSNLAGVKFIPLVLVTLVENMFKHGDLNRTGAIARIDITFENNTLQITTSNLSLMERPSGHRIGLDNIQNRLRHAYGEQASLETYTDNAGYFHTLLRVAYPTSTDNTRLDKAGMRVMN